MNTGEVFVTPEKGPLGGVPPPERGERSPPSLQSLVLEDFNPHQQTKFLRISFGKDVYWSSSQTKVWKFKNNATVEGKECRMWCWRGCWETEIQKWLCSGRIFGFYAKFPWPGLANRFSQIPELNQNCRHTELEAFRFGFPTKKTPNYSKAFYHFVLML